jgi:hypothetical protein
MTVDARVDLILGPAGDRENLSIAEPSAENVGIHGCATSLLSPDDQIAVRPRH